MHEVTKHESDLSDSLSDYEIRIINCDSVESADEEFATLLINHKSVSLKVHSRAETNILTPADFNKVVPKRQRASKLKNATEKLTVCGGNEIPTVGKCFLRCSDSGDTKIFEFYVVQEGKSLLGCSACKNMKLISFNDIDQVETTKSELPESVTAAKSDTLESLTEKQIFDQHADCFTGIGCIAEPYHIKKAEK